MFSAGLSIHVIDPLNRTGKVAIPAHLVSDTKGLDDYRAAAARHENKDFSLCLLFQKGRCNAGSRCHQVHACPDHVLELRTKAASVKCCCAEHGDLHSQGYASGQQMIRLVDHTNPSALAPAYALASFARTTCLDNILRNVRVMDVKVPASKICRLHAQRRCKFGKDCKNIHLCPDAKELSQTNVVVKGCPSIDLSCGISCRSVSSAGTLSKPHSLAESPNETPRCAEPLDKSRGAPLSIDGDFESRNGCSSFLYSDEKVWGGSSHPDGNELSVGVMSVELDMSLFEATMRSLCTDMERVEFSPACANRVQSLLLDGELM